jgi:hypothetical protein
MSDAIEPSPELVPESGLVQALRADISTAEKLAVLARLRRLVEKNRASLHKHVRSFNDMCDEAGRKLPSEGLVQLASRVHESEKGAAEQLAPWIQDLQQALKRPSQEGRHYIEELIKISEAWLTVYRDARTRLLTLASERQTSNDGILRAEPAAGDIDYAELSREHIARYPKIRAALAK